jgi:hypothetical protein
MLNKLDFSCIDILINLKSSFVISYLINTLLNYSLLTNYRDSVI